MGQKSDENAIAELTRWSRGGRWGEDTRLGSPVRLSNSSPPLSASSCMMAPNWCARYPFLRRYDSGHGAEANIDRALYVREFIVSSKHPHVVPDADGAISGMFCPVDGTRGGQQLRILCFL